MNINELLKSQRAILADLEEQVKIYESSDIFVENKQLKAQVEKLTTENADLASRSNQMHEYNLRLKEAIYAHAERERGTLIQNSKDRLDIYFGRAVQREHDKLTTLETDIGARTSQLLYHLQHYNDELSHSLYARIQSFREESWNTIREAQVKLSATKGPLTSADTEAYDNLKKEPLTPEQIASLARRYSLERFVGHRLISIVGIILIIIAAIFAGQFTVMRISDAGRVMAIFSLGGGMLVAGEFFNRRKASVLSLVIAAGGVAILYVALAFGFFALDVLGMIPSLIICVAITATAFVLSTRYRSQTLLVFAYVGGHLPFFAIVTNVDMIYGLMVHFLILNLLVLLVSFRMKWAVSTFIGLGFNAIAVWGVFVLGTASGAYVSPFVLVGYILLAFANYTAVPIIGTYKSKQQFAANDAVVMAINTFVSCTTMYVAFLIFGWNNFMGLLALIYAAIYFWLALVLWVKFESANTMRDFAALTGLVFVVLIIPFQFDIVWLSLGWLLQGTALSIYGIIKNNRRVKYAGMIIYGLCIGAFLLADIVLYIDGVQWSHFGFRYLAVTLGSLLILGAFLYKRALVSNAHKAYKYIVMANFWIYLLYVVNQVEAQISSIYPFNLFYMAGVVQVVLTLGLAFGYLRIRPLYDNGMRILAFLLYMTGIAGLFMLNITTRPGIVPIGIGVGYMWVTVVSTVIIVAVGALAVYCLYDLLRQFAARGSIRLDYMYVGIAIYILTVITQKLLFLYRVEFASLWISLVYIFAAFLWVVFGFAKRTVLVRRLGLALALLTVGKVFLVDLTGLTQGQRVVSLFVMGAVLVGISFIYQLFIKRLELKLDEPADDNEAETN
ncbi:MAG: DUF2339 domain-containing protein [Defluviitaleaceae bacterium]|nr:DUF2339 domain-containing protein [Defluviitaleaceae bacterium]